MRSIRFLLGVLPFALPIVSACSGSDGGTGGSTTGPTTASSSTASATSGNSTTSTASSSSSSGSGGGETSSTATSSTSGSSSSGSSSGGPCTMGATTTLPACTKPATDSIEVPKGCVPTVDGTYHEGEWSDATCVLVGSDPVYLKYSGATLYMAWPMTPSCGCPAQVAFSKDVTGMLDGKQLDLGIFDDPFSATGDATESTSTPGAWGTPGTVASDIKIANPPNTPALVTYEIGIPFSELGIAAGQTDTVLLGISHPMGGVWPTGLTVPTGSLQPSSPSDWGKLTSSANWQ